MRRFVLLTVLLVPVLALTGCGRYFIQKDAYTQVKKAALVQYGVNPGMLMGTPSVDDVRNNTAEQNTTAFAQEMNGKGYEFISMDEMKAKPGYAAGKDKVDGYFAAKGMRFFSTEGEIDSAVLTPETAKKLCEDLGVDAVVAVGERWGTKPVGIGFSKAAYNMITMNMYDKNGNRVWGDAVWGDSTDTVAAPGGIIAGEQAEYVKLNGQALSSALKTAQEHLGK